MALTCADLLGSRTGGIDGLYKASAEVGLAV